MVKNVDEYIQNFDGEVQEKLLEKQFRRLQKKYLGVFLFII